MSLTNLHQMQFPSVPGADAIGRLSVGATPLVLSFEANWRLRTLMLRMLGGALLLSAVGLWVVQTKLSEPEMALIRIGVSVAFFFLAMILLTVRDQATRPEARFDPLRQELRIVRRDRPGFERTLLRRSYHSLGGARLTAATVQLFEADGTLLLEVPLSNALARSRLRDQFSGALCLLN